MEKDNETLKEKVNQLESELRIVKWYLEIMEKGVDTQNLVKEYGIL